MTLIRFAQRSNILVNSLLRNPVLSPLITVVVLIGLGSISGCTDKATEIRERKCTNIRNLIEQKCKSMIKTSKDASHMAGASNMLTNSLIREEINKLNDEFQKECK